MSTSYVTAMPCTLAQAQRKMRKRGWKDGTDAEGKPVLVDAEEKNYAHGLEECEIDGEKHVMFDQWGQNDLSELADLLGAVSEHEEEYNELFGIDDEEE